MCGIAGIINLDNSPVDVRLLSSMNRAVSHRGPDDKGMVLFSGRAGSDPLELIEDTDTNNGAEGLRHYNIGLAHRRLSIIDLSEKGRQPMSDPDRQLWIAHNGEIYNYIEIREELLGKGYIFNSNTDTEVILNAYREWGIDCLTRFNGMWAFAIWDGRMKRLFCSRDRFGIKPFYYYIDSKRFLFSSEIKQILEYKDYGRRPNDRLIYDFLAVGLEDHTDETFFAGIRQLKGGEYALLAAPDFRFIKKRFYGLDDIRETKITENECYETFKEIFYDSISIRLRSDVLLGSCLSGGLDSSAVVCGMHAISGNRTHYNKLEAFTACWEDEKIDERRHSSEAALFADAHVNTVFPSARELKDDLSKLIWHLEEPFGSLSVFAQWSVMKSASKKGVRVLLDGQGGDEVFLGYMRYYAPFLKDLMTRGKIGDLIREFKGSYRNSKLNLFSLIAICLYFNIESIRAFRISEKAKKYLSTELVRTNTLADRMIYLDGTRDLLELQKKEVMDYQLPHLLKYADRNSMAFSVETRLPLLDYRLVEFALSMPSEFKIRNGWTKNIVREAMAGSMPESIRNRKDKIGFEVSQSVLLEAVLPRLKESLKQEVRVGRYVNMKWLRDKVERRELGREIVWRSLCLELWLERFKLA